MEYKLLDDYYRAVNVMKIRTLYLKSKKITMRNSKRRNKIIFQTKTS